MAIRKELIEKLFRECDSPGDLLGPDGLIKQLKAALVERALEAEMSYHLGYERDDPAGQGSGNSRNGCSSKTLRSDDGPLPVKNPRDREGTFEPKIVKKHQRHFDGVDDKILSTYAPGMSVREIQGHLQETYGTEVSPDLISRVTGAVLDEVKQWQVRPLDAVYPIIYLDALVIKVRDQGVVQNKSVYLAIGVTLEGIKEVLGIWIETTEGAKFWLKVITELKNRGLQDMLIVCCDGLKGFPDASEAVFPKAVGTEGLCIVHMIRNSLRFVGRKDRKKVAADLKPVYRAETAEAATHALDEFEEKYGARYPMIVTSWRSPTWRGTDYV
ncbi:MAG: putative transposase [Hyphomicrobiaceae bacterium]|jgi:putative transposase